MDCQRRSTSVPLCFFALGWVLYAIGFCWLLSRNRFSTEFLAVPQYASRTDPSLYPFYVTLIGGPFVAISGTLYALVAIPIIGSILGLISSVLSVIYFVSVGTAALQCSRNITETTRNRQPPGPIDDESANPKVVLMLSGTLIQLVCWCAVLCLSVFYKYRARGNPLQRFNSVRAHSPQRRWITTGLVRVLCIIPCVVLSVIGWCVYTGGKYKFCLYAYGPWSACRTVFYTEPDFLVPLLAYLAALLHAGCSGGASKIMGVFTAILNMIFLSFMGDFMTFVSLDLHSAGGCWSDPNNPFDYYDYCYYERLIIGGGIVCLFFWGCVLALWPFYQLTESPQAPGPPHHHVTDSEQVNRDTSTQYGSVQCYPPLIEH